MKPETQQKQGDPSLEIVVDSFRFYIAKTSDGYALIAKDSDPVFKQGFAVAYSPYIAGLLYLIQAIAKLEGSDTTVQL